MRGFSAALLTAVLVLLLPSVPTDAATTAIAVGAPQKIYGPSGLVDSLYSTVRDAKGRLHGYISNGKVLWFHQRANGSLTNRRVIMSSGGRGSIDQCGVHPAGTIYKDPRAPRTHWIAFYHAEKGAPADHGRCNHFHHHTRWSIARMETFNGGRTWKKRGQVITQDSALLRTAAGGWSYATDDAGSPRLVVSGRFMYLFYRATNRSSSHVQKMTVARAPLGSKGAPGSWRKFFNGAFTEPGLGGQSSGISGLPAAARGISFNSHLQRWVAVKVDITGAYLFQSTDLFTWTPLEQLVATGLTESGFHKPCGPRIPAAYGYGSIVGLNGSSSTSGQSFWVYYMKKPAGKCFDSRFLYRRKVTLP
jgi:hypothetical protein